MSKWPTTICWGLAVSLISVVGLGTPLSSAQGAPPAASYEIAWRADLSATAPLAIALAPSAVIVAGADAPTEAYALDDGRLLWKSDAIGSAVVDNDVVVGASERRLQALSASTGNPLWTVTLDDIAGAPVASGGVVFLTVGMEVRAYRAADGEQAWRYVSDVLPEEMNVAVGEGLAVVGLSDRSLLALDAATGRPRWRTPLPGMPGTSAIHADGVFVGLSTGQTCALTVEGRRSWCYRARVLTTDAPAADARFVYFAVSDNTVRAFNRRNGAMQRPVPLGGRPAGGPRIVGDRVLVPLQHGDFVALGANGTAAPVHAQQPGGPTLAHSVESHAISADGATLAALLISPGGARTLVIYTKRAA